MKVIKNFLAWSNKEREAKGYWHHLIFLFKNYTGIATLVSISFLLNGLVTLQAEELRPVNVRALQCPVIIEEYRRDLKFENNIIKSNPLCMPDYINVDKFRYTFSLSKNLHEQCIKGNQNEQQGVKYALIGLSFSVTSGGLLAPVVVGYFGGEFVTDTVRCSTKALIGTFDSLSDERRSFLYNRIDNIASLKDWAGFITNLSDVRKGINDIKTTYGSIEAYLAVLDRGQEGMDFVQFLATVYSTGERYVKDQIYGEVENYFEDAQKAKEQCQFDNAEKYLIKAEKAAEDNCEKAGKWFRHTEARLGAETTNRAFRLYWKRLLDYRGASTLRGDRYLRCNYKTLKEKTLKDSKSDLDRSSKELSDVLLKIRSRKDLINRRKNALDRKKQEVNTPTDKAIKALGTKAYEAACKLIDDPALSKLLNVWSPECRLQFRNDDQDPLDILRDIEHKINDQSAKLSKQIILLVESAITDINSCLLSNLNSARASLKMADELSSKLLFANNHTCRKYIPNYVSQKLSEGYRVLEMASPHAMEAFLKEIDAGIQPARKALLDCESMKIFTDLKKLKEKLAKKQCKGALGISMRLKEVELLEKTIDPKNCSGEAKKECDIAPTTTSPQAARQCEVRQRFWGYGHGCFGEEKIATLKAEDGTTINCTTECNYCPKGYNKAVYKGYEGCVKCPKGKHFSNGCCR